TFAALGIERCHVDDQLRRDPLCLLDRAAVLAEDDDVDAVIEIRELRSLSRRGEDRLPWKCGLERQAARPVEDRRVLAQYGQVVLQGLRESSDWIGGALGRFRNREDQTAARILEHQSVAVEMRADVGIELEPPARSLRDE